MLLLSGGIVVDGSGSDPFPASVLINDERIAAVGAQITTADCQTIDCSELIIAPGFIDIHSHSDLQVLKARPEKLKQGVTTEVVGNCGFSPFPHSGDTASLHEFAAGILGEPDGWGWRSAASYIKALADVDNRALPLVGHGSLRIAVHGLGQDALSRVELDRMCGLLDDCLDAGCVGLSTGLMYAPGSAAGPEELTALCRCVARRDKLYASHIRSYAETLVDAVQEQIKLAEATGCRLQISHLQSAGRKNWHLQETALAQIEAARACGIDVEFDIYPYQCGSTVLTQLLPQWALDGGILALLQRIRNSGSRAEITRELNERPAGYWNDVTISSVNSDTNSALIGRTVAQAAECRGQRENEFTLDLLDEEAGSVNIVTFNQSESNLKQLLTHQFCSVITDGFYVKGRPHPRLHGTYPELLEKVVRDFGWLSLPEAIHKSTAQPAARIKLKDCGSLQKDRIADIVVFDSNRITSHATYSDPERDPSGIKYVIKRGKIVLEGGQL